MCNQSPSWCLSPNRIRKTALQKGGWHRQSGIGNQRLSEVRKLGEWGAQPGKSASEQGEEGGQPKDGWPGMRCQNSAAVRKEAWASMGMAYGVRAWHHEEGIGKGKSDSRDRLVI